MNRMTEIIINLGCKLGEIFQTVYGWIAAACIFIVNFFAGYECSIHAVIVCVLLDTIWGVQSADELLEDADFIAQLKTKLGIA